MTQYDSEYDPMTYQYIHFNRFAIYIHVLLPPLPGTQIMTSVCVCVCVCVCVLTTCKPTRMEARGCTQPAHTTDTYTQHRRTALRNWRAHASLRARFSFFRLRRQAIIETPFEKKMENKPHSRHPRIHPNEGGSCDGVETARAHARCRGLSHPSPPPSPNRNRRTT